MNVTAMPQGCSWRKLPLIDGLDEAAGSYPETRIGAFDFSEATRTEVLVYASGSAHRASIDSCPEVVADLGFYTQPDPLSSVPGFSRVAYQWFKHPGTNENPDGGPRIAPVDSMSPYLYSWANPLSLTDPLGLSPENAQGSSPDYWSCVGDCIDRNSFSNFYTMLGNALNAGLNKVVGPTGRMGVGGTPSHPTTWQHKAASKMGRVCKPLAGPISRVGRFAGRASIGLTLVEGYYDWGVILGCFSGCVTPSGSCCP